MDPLVSVVIPTHNRVRYLRDAVASVREQTFHAWEAWVIDDASTDDTPRFVTELNDPRVRLVAHDRCRNPARLRNAGIARAEAPYVAFLDSDDLWRPAKLEVQLRALSAHPRARWSYTHFARYDEHGSPLPNTARPRSGWILPDLVAIQVAVAMPTVLAERSLLIEAGGFDETLRYCEDYDLWFRLGAASEALGLPEALSCVRSLADSYSRNRIAVNESWIRAYRKLAATADPEIRRLCRLRCAEVAGALAGHYRAAGRHGAALRAAVASVYWGRDVRRVGRGLRRALAWRRREPADGR